MLIACRMDTNHSTKHVPSYETLWKLSFWEYFYYLLCYNSSGKVWVETRSRIHQYHHFLMSLATHDISHQKIIEPDPHPVSMVINKMMSSIICCINTDYQWLSLTYPLLEMPGKHQCCSGDCKSESWFSDRYPDVTCCVFCFSVALVADIKMAYVRPHEQLNQNKITRHHWRLCAWRYFIFYLLFSGKLIVNLGSMLFTRQSKIDTKIDR